MKTTRKPFVSSARLGAKLSASARAQEARIDAALAAAGCSVHVAEYVALKGGLVSESVALLPDGSKVLVSYETAVAFRLPDSAKVVCVTLGHHSRTTDRSIRRFAGSEELVELSPDAFVSALRAALAA